MTSNFKDNFEEIYLREDYFRKLTTQDVSHLAEFKSIIHHTAAIVFNVNRKAIQSTGFELEDMENIANMYSIYYFNLYSLRNHPDNMTKFLAAFKTRNGPYSMPSNQDVLRKERNNLINFLRQKLFHCVVVFSRKRRSIIVDRDTKSVFVQTQDSKRASIQLIHKEPKKYGYKPVTHKEYKKMKKENTQIEGVCDKDGNVITMYAQKMIGITPTEMKDIVLHKDPSIDDPENQMISMDESVKFEIIKSQFNSMDSKKQKEIIKEFIKQNKKNPLYSEEVKIAHRFIKNGYTWYNENDDKNSDQRI